ncbi:hypothetical protein HGRIS_004698 [Hohenbuehelia grisea]|uniref:Uncharacterized protein n=1 Tax=Hohenbuehelia grisea TaxID=104357 RepID=A0ABR3JD32_9AGAR
MTSSPLLNNFDPFATHPFTNNSGVMPEPPKPSHLPNASPYPRAQPQSPNGQPTNGQPQKQAQKGVFTPFRPDNAPDLHQVLKKK